MIPSQVHLAAHRRLFRRAMFTCVCSLVCAGLAITLQVPSFWLSGIAFNVGSVFNVLAALTERRSAIRAENLERVDKLRTLMGNTPT